MHARTLVPVLLAAALALGGCSAFKKSYEDGFVKSFRTSFMTACKKTPGDEKYCQCTADDVLAHYTPEELTAMQTDSAKLEKAVNDASERCAKFRPQ